MMKRTPFHYLALQAGAVMRQAQGWEMPDHFGDPRAEHMAVRQAVGVFDWASTGEIEITGRDALTLVQKVIVNDASLMEVGSVLYTTLCHPNGAIMSDVTMYRLAGDRYWCMTAWGSNAANQRPEYEWLLEHARGLDVTVTDISPGVALLAVQGPAAYNAVAATTRADLRALPYMRFMSAAVAGVPRALISRTGYTGELGYELIVPAEHAGELWDAVESAGLPHGLRHAGLDTAFSLRMEKGYIARFDFVDDVTPLEAGLGWTVKLDKPDFIGQAALLNQARAGLARRLVSVAMCTETTPPYGALITKHDVAVGKITSSAYGYAVGRPMALALLPVDLSTPRTEVEVLVQGVTHPAEVVRRPFYDPEGRRLRD
jgi:aminomethyltransferase